MATDPKGKEAKRTSARRAPANRLYVFAKSCTNDHGRFAKGDKARGAFSEALVENYLALGILVPAKAPAPASASAAGQGTEDG